MQLDLKPDKRFASPEEGGRPRSTTAAAPTAGSGYCGEIGVLDKASFLLNRKRIGRSFLFFSIFNWLSIGICLLFGSTPGLTEGPDSGVGGARSGKMGVGARQGPGPPTAKVPV